MKINYSLLNKWNLLFIPVALLTLISCGSYQYSGYEADGIYGESRPGLFEQEQPQNNEVRPNSNNGYYKNLFAQQSQMYGEILESDIFTDVESYSSNNGYEDYNDAGGDVVYIGGQAPWGEDPDSFQVNIYNRGFYSPWAFGNGFGWGWGYDPFFYGGWYDPWYGPNWGPYWRRGYWGPMAYGGFGPYWNVGFGFGYGWSYGYPYYGYNRYYNNYYYNSPRYNQRYRNAYVDGRRTSRVYGNGDNRRTTMTSRNSYSRRIQEIRNSRSADATSRRSTTGNDSRVYTRTTRRTESARTYGGSDSSPVYRRSSTPTTQRSSSPSRNSSYGRSSSPSRSTTTRSSSSSTRSSSSGSSSRGSSGRSSRGGRGGI